MLIVTVKKTHAAAMPTELLTAGRVGMKAEFRFSSEWDGLAKIAVFESGTVSKDAVIAENVCDVPHECMIEGEELRIGVYGTDGEGNTVIPSVYALAGRIVRGADPSGDESYPPSPDIGEQALALATAAKEESAELMRRAEAGELAGKDGGYYMPVAVGGEGIATVSFVPSKADMPALPDVTLNVPYDIPQVDRENLVTKVESGSSSVKVSSKTVTLTYVKPSGSQTAKEAYFTVTASNMVEGGEYVLAFDCDGMPADTGDYVFEFKITRGGDKKFIPHNGHNTIPFTKTGTKNESIFIDDTAGNSTRPTAALVGAGVILSNITIYPAEHVKVTERALNRSVTPTLTYEQRAALHNLALDYYNNRTAFGYDWDATRNNYANNYCWKDFYKTETVTDSEGNPVYNADGSVKTQKVFAYSRFILCCATFIEMVWMGRKIEDFKNKDGDNYSNAIQKAFDWGYYFTHRDRSSIGGAVQKNETDANGKPDTTYYKYKQPLGKGIDEYSYSVNTGYNADRIGDENYSNAQGFSGFLMAHDMAKELYRMGCEIPFSELDVGDIVFLGNRWDSPVNEHLFTDSKRFRGIGHVAMVYSIKDNGIITFIDCTDDVFVDGDEKYDKPILTCSEEHSDRFDRVRAISTLDNIVMCARHPAAWGKGNMTNIDSVDFMTMAVTDGLKADRAILLDFSSGAVNVESGKWYTDGHRLGKVYTTANVSKWEDITFSSSWK